MSGLVLSLFPGIGLFDRAFEEMGFCVVRGPDLLWGGDVRVFHPPAGRFEGVIGGPPCQAFSQLRHLQAAQGREMRFGNLIPEYERVVAEAQPEWFLMENVPAAPVPAVLGYVVHSYRMNNRWVPDTGGIGAEQSRLRLFSFGTPDGRELAIEVCALEAPLREPDASVQGTEAVMVRGTCPGAAPAAVTARHAGRLPWKPQSVLSSTRAVPVRIGGSGRVKVTAPGAVSSAHGSLSARSNARLRAPGAVTSSDGSPSVRMARYTVAEACVLQGLPADYLDDAPFTQAGKLKAVANGVPLSLGRAIARAVLRATQREETTA